MPKEVNKIDSPINSLGSLGNSASIAEKLSAIFSFFGLSKSDIARILHVSRPSLYAWLKGQSEPGLENMRTIHKLYSLIEPSETGTWSTIFYGYIEKPFGAFKKSLIGALSEPELKFISAMTQFQEVLAHFGFDRTRNNSLQIPSQLYITTISLLVRILSMDIPCTLRVADLIRLRI